MAKRVKILSIIFQIAVLLTGAAIILSCDSNIEVIVGSEVKDLPSLTVRNFETVQTDSGRIQMILKSPVLERYSQNDDPYNEFPVGINVVFYDGRKEPVASLSAGYAKYNDNKKIWELKYDVKARNENNELLETELLFWEEEKGIIHTDRFVRITGEERIISGTGFESDTRFSKWEIRNGNAIIYIKDE